MEIILDYVKQLLDLFQQLLDALGIVVDWEALLGVSEKAPAEEEEPSDLR